MTEVVAAPVEAPVADVTPSTPTHVADAAKADSFADRMARAKAKFEAKPEAKAAEPVAEEAVADSKVEPAKPVEKPDHVDAKSEAAHVRALAALRKVEAENLRLKSESKAAADKIAAEAAADREALKALRDQLKSYEKNPTAALKAAGLTAEQFMRGVVDGTIKPPAPDDVLGQELAQIKAELAERREAEKAAEESRREAAAQREQEERQTAARVKDLEVVRQVITADEYPITAALGAFDVVLNACYESGSQDVAGKAAEFEAHQIALLENLITPDVLSALSKRSAKIRETVGTLRGGQSRQTAVSSGGPRVAAARDVVSAPSTGSEAPRSEAERMARAKALLNGLK